MEGKSKEWEAIYETEREIEILTAKKTALMEMYEKIYAKPPNFNSIKGDLRKKTIRQESQFSSNRVIPRTNKNLGIK
ncbi:hypothetical protein DSAG12_04360 [Promethearchaeum syntrophicum]|uniref:Uncharacterized protein n=1 Tax=Promethearchaeum syntrophicum TaxID=2594042 RepID=A0AC61ZU16_9ARCH